MNTKTIISRIHVFKKCSFLYNLFVCLLFFKDSSSLHYFLMKRWNNQKKKTRKRLWIITQFSFHLFCSQKKERKNEFELWCCKFWDSSLFFSFVLWWWDFEIFFLIKKRTKRGDLIRKTFFFIVSLRSRVFYFSYSYSYSSKILVFICLIYLKFCLILISLLLLKLQSVHFIFLIALLGFDPVSRNFINLNMFPLSYLKSFYLFPYRIGIDDLNCRFNIVNSGKGLSRHTIKIP